MKEAMSTAEAAEEQERAVFEDEDFDDDDSDDSEDDDDEDTSHATAPPAALSQPQPAPAAGDQVPSAASLHVADTIPDPAPNPTPSDPAGAPIPRNGAMPVVLAISAAVTAPSAVSTALAPVSTTSASEERRSLSAVSFDESRRLFQRLWTDEEEIRILQGFLEFTSKRGTTFASHQYDTGPFYEEIKKQLHFDFTKNQLIEKLRRLKKKYRNCVSRMRSTGKDFAFKSSHERAIYDIARNIWSASAKRAHESDDEDLNSPNNAVSNEIFTVPINEGSFGSDRRIARSRRRLRRKMSEETAAAAVAAVGVIAAENSTPVMHTTPAASSAGIPSIIEETVKSCLSPLFKELINSAIGGQFGPALSSGTSPLNLLPLSVGGSLLGPPKAPEDDKWRKQQILELEVYLKRLEIVRDHIASMLEELKSTSN